jgi:predicted transcriptional regulator
MAGHAHLQQQVLAELPAGACLTVDQLVEVRGMSRRDISTAACGLIRRGYLERVERGCYQLTQEGLRAKESGDRLTCGPAAPLTQVCRRPRRRTHRDLLWFALRILGTSGKPTIADLLEVAGLDQAANYSNALRFLQALRKAGIVRRMPRREQALSLTSNGCHRYLLRKDLGPQTPVERREGLFDPNSKTFVKPEASA